MQSPDLLPCIQQETHGARNCIAVLESMEKDTIDVFDKISHLLADHTKKWTRRLNNDSHVAEYPMIKQLFINLASVGTIFAEGFDSASHRINNELVAIEQPPKCIFKKNMQKAYEPVEKSNKKLADLVKQQDDCQAELNKLNEQLNNTVMKKEKRHEIQSKKKTFENRLEEYEIRVKTADNTCQTAKNKYQHEVIRLYSTSQRRELEQLRKLTTYLQGYIEAVQVPSCKKGIRRLNDQLMDESELKHELTDWQKKMIGLNLNDKQVAITKHHHQLYAVQEPSSDEDGDDDHEENSTAVVRYEPTAKQHHRRQS